MRSKDHSLNYVMLVVASICLLAVPLLALSWSGVLPNLGRATAQANCLTASKLYTIQTEQVAKFCTESYDEARCSFHQSEASRYSSYIERKCLVSLCPANPLRCHFSSSGTTTWVERCINGSWAYYQTCSRTCQEGQCVDRQVAKPVRWLDLSQYPDRVVQDGMLNAYLVVGESSPTSDVVAAVDIAESLERVCNVPKGSAKLATENLMGKDIWILIGTPCSNPMIEGAYRRLNVTETNCSLMHGLGPNQATLRLVQIYNRSILLVTGYDSLSVRRAARVLVNWQQYGLRGAEVCVRGSGVTDLYVTLGRCPVGDGPDQVHVEPCTDSDGGRNYTVKGYAIPPAGSGNWDFCNGTSVVEYYCHYGDFARETYQCVHGCRDGACLPEPREGACSETDGGLNYHLQGSATGSAYVGDPVSTLTDYCYTSKTLNEAECKDDGFVLWVGHVCPGSCRNGVCIATRAFLEVSRASADPQTVEAIPGAQDVEALPFDLRTYGTDRVRINRFLVAIDLLNNTPSDCDFLNARLYRNGNLVGTVNRSAYEPEDPYNSCILEFRNLTLEVGQWEPMSLVLDVPSDAWSGLTVSLVAQAVLSAGSSGWITTMSGGSVRVVMDEDRPPSGYLRIVSAQAACTETDGGVVYAVRGVTTGPPVGGGEQVVLSDYCIDTGLLNEARCTQQAEAGWVVYQCPSGCANGACTGMGALADFTVGNMTVQPERPAVNQTATLSFMIYNLGVDSVLPGFSVEHVGAVPGTTSQQCSSTNGMPSGASCVETLVLTYPSPGYKLITITVDDSLSVQESNENNNRVSILFEVT